MTTSLMEQGTRVDSGESSANQDTSHRTLEQAARQARLAGALALAESPMDENYPFYDEWLEHVESQPHQGC